MVADTLALLSNWYSEPSEGNDRPKLISKLAILELCGWLEGWMDDFVLELGRASICDEKWTKEKVVEKTSGFDYVSHLRPMMSKIIGEHNMLIVEARLETVSAGDLDQLKSLLGTLWKKRCSFAHADVVANVNSQTTFDAPSWAANQFRIISKKLEKLREVSLSLAGSMTKT